MTLMSLPSTLTTSTGCTMTAGDVVVIRLLNDRTGYFLGVYKPSSTTSIKKLFPHSKLETL